MCADRAVRQEELLTDFTVREALSRELSDLQFLRGQFVTRLGDSASAALARRPPLAAGPASPVGAPGRVERGPGSAHRGRGDGAAPVASQPPAMGEQEAATPE